MCTCILFERHCIYLSHSPSNLILFTRLSQAHYSKAWKYYNICSHHIQTSRNITFDESDIALHPIPDYVDLEALNNGILQENLRTRPEHIECTSNILPTATLNPSTTPDPPTPPPSNSLHLQSQQVEQMIQSQCLSHKPRLTYCELNNPHTSSKPPPQNNTADLISPEPVQSINTDQINFVDNPLIPPSTYQEALKHTYFPVWLEAMCTEMAQHQNLGT